MKNNSRTALVFHDTTLQVVDQDGEAWLRGLQIASALGFKNPSADMSKLYDRNARDAVKALDADEVRQVSDLNTVALTDGIRAPRGNPTFNLTSESGFYTLILRCRDAIKPGSMPHRVRRWVTGEVLPSIRKTGGYSVKRQVPRDRQIGRCQALMRDIERSESKVCRDGLIVLVGTAFADLGLDLPDMNGLRPLQMPLLPQGGAS
jgi:prophage antirepressor-like protein